MRQQKDMLMLSFGPFVELFSIDGIDMIGNVDSGAIAGLTPQAMRACQQVKSGQNDGSEIANTDKRLFDFLKKGCFFDSEPRFDHPLEAYVHVTQRCNLRCIGCYSFSTLRNAVTDPSRNDLQRAFEQLAGCGAQSVNISGGEPFLRADLVEIAKLARESGLASVNIVTNGTAIADHNLDDLARWASAVIVSIDGTSPTAPAYIRGEQRFNTLMATIRELKAAGIPVRILPTLHARNISDVGAYIELAKDLGVNLRFSLLSPPPECNEMAGLIPGDDQLEQLSNLQLESVAFADFSEPFGIELKAKRMCGAGCQTLSVDADGSVYPCHMLHIDSLRMGNLFDEELEDILLRSPAIMNEWLVPASKIKPCNSCEYEWVCGGGCRARAINCGAGPDEADPYCSLSKGFYKKLFSALSASVS